jgi:predicted amino acid-binding ACT domain protein
MAHTIRRVDYFYATLDDRPGEAYELLSQLADLGVNLVAITAVPVGPMRTQLTIFPEDSRKMADAAGKSGLDVDGPNPALLLQGDDELGALATVHRRLAEAGVNVFASSGVSGGRGTYGYVLYVRPEHYDRAAAVLDV